METKEEVSIFLSPTYRCSGNCLFCYLDKESRMTGDDMTFLEVKKNIELFSNIYTINYIDILGGDPYLWKYLDKLLNYVNEKYIERGIIKDLILSGETISFFQKKRINTIENIFNKKNTLQIPINIYRKKKDNLKIIKKQIICFAEKKVRVRYVIFFVKNYLEDIENFSFFLADIFNKYYKGRSENFSVELRLPFGDYLYKDGNIFIAPADKFCAQLKKIYRIFFKNKVNVYFRNIPLCYIDYKETAFYKNNNKRRNDKIILINKENQLENAMFKNYNTSYCGTYDSCRQCSINTQCNGISSIYLDKYNYPPLNPIY